MRGTCRTADAEDEHLACTRRYLRAQQTQTSINSHALGGSTGTLSVATASDQPASHQHLRIHRSSRSSLPTTFSEDYRRTSYRQDNFSGGQPGTPTKEAGMGTNTVDWSLVIEGMRRAGKRA